jgi:hypothetical protein
MRASAPQYYRAARKMGIKRAGSSGELQAEASIV